MRSSRSCSYCTSKLRTRFWVKGREILSCPRCHLEQVASRYQARVTDLIEEFKTSYLVEYLEEEASYKRYFKRHLRSWPKIAPGARLLDVGCAQGFFLEEAKRQGFRVEGVDASGEISRRVRQQGIRVYVDLFENVSLRLGSYQVIALFQTLEHVRDLQAVLRKVYGLLKPDGYLVLTTPDRQGFLGRVMGKWWFTYYNHEHLYFFNQTNISQLLTQAGFKVKKIYTEHGRGITVKYVLSRLMHNYYTSGVIKYILQGLRWLLRPWWQWQFHEPWVNVVALAQKPGQLSGAGKRQA